MQPSSVHCGFHQEFPHSCRHPSSFKCCANRLIVIVRFTHPNEIIAINLKFNFNYHNAWTGLQPQDSEASHASWHWGRKIHQYGKNKLRKFNTLIKKERITFNTSGDWLSPDDAKTAKWFRHATRYLGSLSSFVPCGCLDGESIVSYRLSAYPGCITVFDRFLSNLCSSKCSECAE